MSKKQKRRVSQSASVSVQNTAAQASTANAAAQIRTRSTIFEFKPDYTYIKRDLRRIVMLAGSFIVVLVVLSFFLR
jgi:hypothetical protein